MNSMIGDIKTKTNVIKSNFYYLEHNSRCHLFNSQCLSLYGCELSNLYDKNVSRLCTAWRVCCRKVAKLPKRTHSAFLHEIFKTNTLYDILSQRGYDFLGNGINHNTKIVRSVLRKSFINYSSYFF